MWKAWPPKAPNSLPGILCWCQGALQRDSPRHKQTRPPNISRSQRTQSPKALMGWKIAPKRAHCSLRPRTDAQREGMLGWNSTSLKNVAKRRHSLPQPCGWRSLPPTPSSEAHGPAGRSPPGSDLRLRCSRSRDCGLVSAWRETGTATLGLVLLPLSPAVRGGGRGWEMKRGWHAPVLRRGGAEWGGIETRARETRGGAPR